MDETPITRRSLVAGAAVVAGGALLGKLSPADQQQAGATTQAAAAPPPVLADPTKAPGGPTTAGGTGSPFVNPQRKPLGDIPGTRPTPLQPLAGTLPPSDLLFARFPPGVPTIDPAKHPLVIHGLVD